MAATALPGAEEVWGVVWGEGGNGREDMICKETQSVQTNRRTGPNKQ